MLAIWQVYTNLLAIWSDRPIHFRSLAPDFEDFEPILEHRPWSPFAYGTVLISRAAEVFLESGVVPLSGFIRVVDWLLPDLWSLSLLGIDNESSIPLLGQLDSGFHTGHRIDQFPPQSFGLIDGAFGDDITSFGFVDKDHLRDSHSCCMLLVWRLKYIAIPFTSIWVMQRPFKP